MRKTGLLQVGTAAVGNWLGLKTRIGRRILAGLCAALCGVSAAAGQAPCPDDWRVQNVLDAVRREAPVARPGPLKVDRLRELDEGLLGTVMRERTTYAGPAAWVEFYQVAWAPYSVAAGRADLGVVELHQHQEWIVALDTAGRSAFVLAGGDRAVESYNRLAVLAGIKIQSGDDAEALLGFYVDCVRGLGFAKWHVIQDLEQLHIFLLQDKRRGAVPALRADVDTLWRQKLPALKRLALTPKATPASGGGFEVRYHAYENGSVIVFRVLVRSNGSVQDLGETVAMRLW